VYSFDPDIEARVQHGPGYTSSAVVDDLRHDLQTLPMLFARADDVVRVDSPPRLEWLLHLEQSGFELPEFATTEQLAGRDLGERRPWGPDAPECRELYSKAWAAQWRPETTVWRSTGDVRQALGAVLSEYPDALIKAPWSTSGQSRRPVRRDAPDGDRDRWVARMLASQGALLVEPRFERLLDLSVQLTVRDSGPRVDGHVRFQTDQHGRFLGAICAPIDWGLPTDWRRFLAGDGQPERSVARQLDRVAETVGVALHGRGFRGPAGIDAMVIRGRTGPKLVPLLEVNPRFTMGRIALALRKRIAPGHGGVFSIEPVTVRNPPDNATARDDQGRLTGGTVLTTDPSAAHRFVARLRVSKEATAPPPPW
jgi:hypothetical protein